MLKDKNGVVFPFKSDAAIFVVADAFAAFSKLIVELLWNKLAVIPSPFVQVILPGLIAAEYPVSSEPDAKGKPVKIPDEIYSKFKPYFCDTIKT